MRGILRTEYDQNGNISRDEFFVTGELDSVWIYRYDAFDELIEQTRLTDGGTLVDRRTVIRFSDETIDGAYYRLREEYTYSENEVQPASGAAVLAPVKERLLRRPAIAHRVGTDARSGGGTP